MFVGQAAAAACACHGACARLGRGKLYATQGVHAMEGVSAIQAACVMESDHAMSMCMQGRILEQTNEARNQAESEEPQKNSNH